MKKPLRNVCWAAAGKSPSTRSTYCTLYLPLLLLLLLLLEWSSSRVVVLVLLAQLGCFDPLPWLLGLRRLRRFALRTGRIEQLEEEEEEGRLEAEVFKKGIWFLPLIDVQKNSILRGEGTLL